MGQQFVVYVVVGVSKNGAMATWAFSRIIYWIEGWQLKTCLPLNVAIYNHVYWICSSWQVLAKFQNKHWKG